MAANLPHSLEQIAELRKSILNGTATVTVKPVMVSGEGGDYQDTAYIINTPSGTSAEATLQSGGKLALDLSSPDSKTNYLGYFNFDPITGKTSPIGNESNFMAPHVNVGSRGGLFGDVGNFAGDFLSSDLGKIAAVAAMYYGGPAALDALSSGAATSIPEAINMGTGAFDAAAATGASEAVGGTGLGTALTGALPAGSEYVAPTVTDLGTVASTDGTLPAANTLDGIANTGLPTGVSSADLAAEEAAANASMEGVTNQQVSNSLSSMLPAAATTAASTLASAGSKLSDVLPYVAGANLVGGLVGANTAKTAAQIQADAANAAAEKQQVNLDLINKQLTPYRAGGAQALNTLGSMGTGPYQTYDAAGNVTGTGTGSGYLQHQFNAADLKAGLAPNYDFMLQQGQMANQRAANLAGGGLGGNALQGLNKFTQDYAGNAYQNAFTNYQNQRSNIYNTLAGIAGLGMTGQNAANTAMTNATNAATQLGVGSAGAQAAGQVGASNAIGNTINNIASQYTLASLLNQKGSLI